MRLLEATYAGSETIETIEAKLQRLARKARINIQENLADALLQTWKELKAVAADDFQDEDEIKLSNLPEQLQFLLELATPPLASTLAHADIILSGERERVAKSSKLTWAQIMEEEPFEGEHWADVFSPSGPQAEDSDDSSVWERDSGLVDGLAASDEESIASHSSPPTSYTGIHFAVERRPQDGSHDPSLDGRELIEQLRQRQNWRPEWTSDTKWTRPFNLADPSTLGAAVSRIMEPRIAGRTHVPKNIDEADAIRDVLLLLQGIDSPLTSFLADDFNEMTQASIAPDAPRLMHLSLDAYRSILTEFCFTATRLQEMRYFAKSIYSSRDAYWRRKDSTHKYTTSPPPPCKTLEALAEAIEDHIRGIDRWCAGRETMLIQARSGTGRQIVATLLSTCHDMKERMALTLEVIQNIFRSVVKDHSPLNASTHHRGDVEKLGFLRSKHLAHIPPHVLSTRILDLLYQAISTHVAIGEHSTASHLTTIFITTAEPLWSSIGRWMKEGIKTGIGSSGVDDLDEEDNEDPELFVRRHEVDFLDPDFWEHGYTLRREDDGDHREDRPGREDAPQLVPKVFSTVAADILSAGKVIGLLRALGIDLFDEEEAHSGIKSWASFTSLFGKAKVEAAAEDLDNREVKYAGDAVSATRSLELALADYLAPWFAEAHGKMSKLLLDDCAMMEHLLAMENLFFMRRGDAMTSFCDQLFAKLDAREKWHDMHFLNRALRDVASVDRKPWIDVELVQFQVRGGRERNNLESVRCFDGLVADYAVSFPLTYLLRRPSTAVYNSIFVLLSQIRRARSGIDGIGLKNVMKALDLEEQHELNPAYALRGKLSWFINTFLSFLATHVIDAGCRHIGTNLSGASTLDEMIQSHDHHLAQLQILCFLHSKTVAVHRILLSIMDLSLQFASCFHFYMDERATQKPSDSVSTTRPKRRRRHQKRARLHQRNTIGFSDYHPTSEDEASSSSSEEEVIREEDLEAGGTSAPMERPSLMSSISFAEEPFEVKVDRMSDELDGLVKYVRKAVDVLAGGSTETARTFAVLSFMLEEWDM